MTEQLLMIITDVLKYGGGSAVIAYLLFKYLGKKWIEDKFAQRLETYKHDQAKELQRLRIEIDLMLSGVLKIQEKEFETLPEAWQKLDEAFGQVSSLVAPFQQYPDVDRMNDAKLEEFLASSELYETQKEEIRNSQDKGRLYTKIIFWHRLTKVKQACVNYHNYVTRNGIFIPLELKEKFTKVADLLWSAIIDKEVGHEADDYKMQNEGWKKIKDEIEPLRKAIEDEIQKRLHKHGYAT